MGEKKQSKQHYKAYFSTLFCIFFPSSLYHKTQQLAVTKAKITVCQVVQKQTEMCIQFWKIWQNAVFSEMEDTVK